MVKHKEIKQVPSCTDFNIVYKIVFFGIPSYVNILDIFLTSSEMEKDKDGTRRKYQSGWSHYGHLGSFRGRLKGRLRKSGDQRGAFLDKILSFLMQYQDAEPLQQGPLH